MAEPHLLARLAALADRPVDRLPDDVAWPRGRSAVLHLVVTDDEPGLVLTRRAARRRTDPGRVALPGGRIENGETAAEAACREASEELGVDPADIEVVGRLDDAWSGAGFHIVPVVGRLRTRPRLQPRPGEVDAAAVIPLARLAEPDHHRREATAIDGFVYENDILDIDDWTVYGLTADLVLDLLAWLAGGDRRRVAARAVELRHFSARRW